MSKIHAVFQKGVFLPLQPVSLPENCEVVFEPLMVRNGSGDDLEEIYSILSERYESGEADVAARHNEHQP